jgi:hypothetical protein
MFFCKKQTYINLYYQVRQKKLRKHRYQTVGILKLIEPAEGTFQTLILQESNNWGTEE